MPLRPGELLASRFRLVEPVPGGGVVRWLADDVDAQAPALLSVAASSQAPPEDLEAQALSLRVQHRALAASRGLFRLDETWVHVTDAPLPTPLGAGFGRRAEAREVIEVARQLAGALAALHAVGAVHGEVVCEAVSTRGLTVQLGCARGRWGGRVLQAGQVAPERYAGGPCTAASDLYGLGVVLYTYASGSLPFGDDGWRAVGRQQRPPAPLSHLPSGLCAMVMALLSTSPGDRPTAHEVERGLHRLRLALGTAPLERSSPVLRPRATHAVVGRDPETGGEVVVLRAGSRGRARSVCRELVHAGWEARTVRVALGGRDLAGALLLGVLGHLVVPLAGFVLLAALWLAHRASGLRQREVAALPELRRRRPRAHRQQARSGLVGAGVALMLAGPLMMLAPWLSAALVAVAVLVVFSEHQQPTRHPASVLRVELVLEDLERIAHSIDDPDRELGLLGELQALRQGWESGRENAAGVLQSAERLSRLHGTATAPGSSWRSTPR